MNSMDSNDRDRKKVRILIYFALFLITFLVRFYSSDEFFLSPVDDEVRNFEVFDSCYHMRRVWMTLDDYPSTPFYDAYHYYPDNPTIPWPAGYTLFLATIAKPFDLIFDSTLVTETVVGVIPCIVDGVTVMLFFFFFSCYIPFYAASVSALLIALSFVNVAYAEAGYIDHHYFINFIIALSACLLSLFDRKPCLKRGIVVGAVLGFAIFFNVSLIQYIILFLVSIIGGLFLSKDLKSRLIPTSAIFFAALAAAFISALTTPAGRSFQIRYDEISLFQVLMIFLLMLAGGVVLIFFKRDILSRRSRIVLSSIIAAIVLLLAFATYRDFLEGARFVLMGNRLNGAQSEEASIFEYYQIWWKTFTWCIVLAPFGVLQFVRRMRKEPLFYMVFALFLAHGCLTGLSHFLYVQFLFPWLTLLTMLGAHYLIDKFKRKGVVRYAIILPFVVQAGYVTWTEHIVENDYAKNDRRFSEQAIKAFRWLRENTLATSYYDRGDGKPEYSIMASRDFGHQIVRTARRPVVLSPFSTPDFLEHMQDYIRLTFSSNEEEAVEFMDKYESKYLVVDDREIRYIDFMMGILEGEDDYPKYRSTVSMNTINFIFRNNLLLFDGVLNWRNNPSAKRFRLVYEGRSKLKVQMMTSAGLRDHKYNNFKIYEYVPGATVKGKGFTPNEQVVFQIELSTNTKRRFTYSVSAKADERGIVETSLPYSSEQTPNSAVFPVTPYYNVISKSGGSSRLIVKEDLVKSGGSVSLN